MLALGAKHYNHSFKKKRLPWSMVLPKKAPCSHFPSTSYRSMFLFMLTLIMVLTPTPTLLISSTLLVGVVLIVLLHGGLSGFVNLLFQVSKIVVEMQKLWEVFLFLFNPLCFILWISWVMISFGRVDWGANKANRWQREKNFGLRRRPTWIKCLFNNRWQ
jgi:hypothetical protein